MKTKHQYGAVALGANPKSHNGKPDPIKKLARKLVLTYGGIDAKHLVQTPLPIDVPVIPRHRGRPRTAPAATGRQRGRPRKRG